MHQTYRASAPPSTHYRQATCQEVDCSKYLNGWHTVKPANIEPDQWYEFASFMRRNEYRMSVREYQDNEGYPAFYYAAGQICFEGRSGSHRISLERPSIFTINNGLGYGFSRREPAQWVDEMGEQLDKIRG